MIISEMKDYQTPPEKSDLYEVGLLHGLFGTIDFKINQRAPKENVMAYLSGWKFGFDRFNQEYKIERDL